MESLMVKSSDHKVFQTLKAYLLLSLLPQGMEGRLYI